MTLTDYQSTPGLSNSMMKDLAVSQLRFWHRWLNPARVPEEPTAEMQLGTALHCAMLEPLAFHDRFACELEPPEGTLDTMDELRQWLRDNGVAPKGTRKADVIGQVQMVNRHQPILEVLKAQHAAQHAGKVVFKAGDWLRIYHCSDALRAEPVAMEILSIGECEVALSAPEPTTGVLLKGKLDWLNPGVTLDIKTFSSRGKSIDRTVADAIYYNDYVRQAYIYSLLRGGSYDHVLAFVESEPPHEVRIKVLRPGNSLYWQKARAEVIQLCRLYAECQERFGDKKPWREPRELEPLQDEEMPGLVYG